MNGGQACRMIEQEAWEAGPLPIPHTSEVPQSAPRSRRSADTVPASDPFSSLNAGRPDWCVDVGEALLTMTTFELWSAIERRDVAPWMRVWREGMECWTPVQDLPELCWAAGTALAWPPGADPPRAEVMLPPPLPAAIDDASAASLDAPPETMRSSDLRDASTPHTSALASLEVTPAPVATEAPAHARPASGVRWLVGGSLVAALALGFALLRALASPASPRPAVHAAAPPAPVEATAPAIEAPSPAIAATPAPTTSATADPREIDPPRIAAPARHEDRGQRRLPRGGRRAYGR